MQIDLSIVLLLKDAETSVASMVRGALAIARSVEPPDGRRGDLAFEILAMDQTSRDNTLSKLAILHAQVAQLRTIQDLETGTAVLRASRIAQGHVWMFIDRPIDVELGAWSVQQVLGGHRAALVPGEVLVVEKGLGQSSLGWLHTGLVGAQTEVQRQLTRMRERPAYSPPPDRGLPERARLFFRARLPRIGLVAALDAPTKGE
jgi:hypothetical protein